MDAPELKNRPVSLVRAPEGIAGQHFFQEASGNQDASKRPQPASRKNLRNGHGQTTAAAFSARARPGLGVSMPISWDKLKELKSGSQWTIATAREYLSFQENDPWADLLVQQADAE